MFQSLTGAVELGLMYALLALGVYITFRILDFPDLTVDGSFATGGAVAAVMISNGYAAWIATLLAFACGLAAGAITGLLHTKGKINGLLSGILMMIALYSINIRILGKPNISLIDAKTLFSSIASKTWLYILVLAVVILVIKTLLDAFLHTDRGLSLRATGDNKRMIRSLGGNTDTSIVLGISLANGLVAISGALVAQDTGFADVNMGVGMIVIGLASVIIGEAIVGTRSVFWATLAVIVGSIVYRIVLALAYRAEWLHLKSTDLKLITALIVIVALVIPTINRYYKQKSLARRRTAELAAAARGKGAI
ncbi:ABC transporter permease [Cohnella nanjingensis]|uniref:ABC transporter permease n=1 Tax=Cohnella nanjingensis TaxID=1387779 RepID=A0A7X0RR35_9BACL|nr:ABC transporter permease [Cohnella nanjingensis]MBB6672092.1 ABC transporter permease [Cohnella nanjingensis]